MRQLANSWATRLRPSRFPTSQTAICAFALLIHLTTPGHAELIELPSGPSYNSAVDRFDQRSLPLDHRRFYTLPPAKKPVVLVAIGDGVVPKIGEYVLSQELSRSFIEDETAFETCGVGETHETGTSSLAVSRTFGVALQPENVVIASVKIYNCDGYNVDATLAFKQALAITRQGNATSPGWRTVVMMAFSSVGLLNAEEKEIFRQLYDEGAFLIGAAGMPESQLWQETPQVLTAGAADTKDRVVAGTSPNDDIFTVGTGLPMFRDSEGLLWRGVGSSLSTAVMAGIACDFAGENPDAKQADFMVALLANATRARGRSILYSRGKVDEVADQLSATRNSGRVTATGRFVLNSLRVSPTVKIHRGRTLNDACQGLAVGTATLGQDGRFTWTGSVPSSTSFLCLATKLTAVAVRVR